MKKEAIQIGDLDIKAAIRQLKTELGINAKPGRPVNPNSKRQQQLTKRTGRYDKPGRPVDPTSERQKKLMEQFVKLQDLKEQLSKDWLRG